MSQVKELIFIVLLLFGYDVPVPDKGQPVCFYDHVWIKYPQVIMPTYKECANEPCVIDNTAKEGP